MTSIGNFRAVPYHFPKSFAKYRELYRDQLVLDSGNPVSANKTLLSVFGQ